MHRTIFAAIGVAAITAVSFACSSSSEPLTPTLPAAVNNAPSDGSTLKATAPAPQAPVNDVRLETFDRPTLRANGSTPAFSGNVALQYRFQLMSASGALVQESPLMSAASWTVSRDLDIDTKYMWRVRAELDGSPGPWSTTASFFTLNGGFIRGSQVFDPLVVGRSVGSVGGGTFTGSGWRANSVTDFIDYDIPTLTAGRLEFDIIGVSSDEPGPYDIGMKFYSMGDGSQWDFIGFRNQPWKASLDKKSGKVFKGESGVIEHIFRLFDDDNRTKTGQNSLHEEQVYHVSLTWGRGHVTATVGDMLIADENYSGEYAPPNHRISLGCRSRGETLVGATWSNVRITPQ